MNILSVGDGKVCISLSGLQTTIDNLIFDDLSIIARLLTYDEVLRLNSFTVSTDLGNLLVEEDVFSLTFERIVGLPDDIDLDIENMEAGIIATVSYAIITKSISHIVQAEQYIDNYVSEVTPIESMQMIVARYSSTSFDDVSKYPINKLFSQFAVIKTAFPHEIVQQTAEENESI